MFSFIQSTIQKCLPYRQFLDISTNVIDAFEARAKWKGPHQANCDLILTGIRRAARGVGRFQGLDHTSLGSFLSLTRRLLLRLLVILM